MKASVFILSLIFVSAGCTTKKQVWKEANSYKTSITGTTFLKTREPMSYAAIDPLTGEGFNKDYAFNQVIYLKALQRARKHLSVINNQLECDLTSGAEIYISEDLYQFITELFKEWNAWLKSGRFEIGKDEQGLYTVLPKESGKVTSGMHWGHLIDKNEGVFKVCVNKHIHQTCREKTKDVILESSSISNKRAYMAIVSHTSRLTYKNETDFYREDRQGKLHKVPDNDSIDRESVASQFEKGETAEIRVDFPQNCQPGDYLLKIKVYDEQEECYEIYHWFEAYTSKQISQRDKPIKLDPLLPLDHKAPPLEDDVFSVVQNMPEFPGGGMPKLMEFIQDNLQYNNKAIDGIGSNKRVIVQFIIDKDGTVTAPTVIRRVSADLDKEALRVIKIMPKWKPGNQHGVPVKVRFTIPVTFHLNPSLQHHQPATE